VWNLNNGSLVTTLYGHTLAVTSLVILPNGILASADSNGVLFWDTQADKITVRSASVVDMMYNPKYGPNGALYIIQRMVRFYDAVNFTEIIKFDTIEFPKYADIHAPTGTMYMDNGNCVIAPLYLNNTLGTRYTYSTYITTIKILPDNETMAVGAIDHNIILFNVRTLTWGASYTGQSSNPIQFGMTPDLVFLLSSNLEGSISVWSWTTGRLTFVIKYWFPATPMNFEFITPTFTGGKTLTKI
jgi:WD40 repeat protein